MKIRTLAQGLVGIIALVIALATAGAAMATDNTCPKAGKVDVTGNHKTVTITAPEGKLIAGYCVKAGSAKQNLGPVTVWLDEPVASVTITRPSGKDISHYTVFYVPKETPSTTATGSPSTTATATATHTASSTTSSSSSTSSSSTTSASSSSTSSTRATASPTAPTSAAPVTEPEPTDRTVATGPKSDAPATSPGTVNTGTGELAHTGLNTVGKIAVALLMLLAAAGAYTLRRKGAH